MKRLISIIKQRLSLRLGLLIAFIVMVIFSLLFGFLLHCCKRYIERATFERATQLLNNTAVRIDGILADTELAATRQPSTRYQPSDVQKSGCWHEPHLYAEPDIDPEPVWYISFTTPLYDSAGQLIGVGCADLSLKWLSQTVTGIKPFANSSAIMIDHDGRYIVHPDSFKIVTENIFSDAAPEARGDIEILGKAMLNGESGMTETIVDGHDSFIFYRPLERTGWSIAIVCPASDVFSRYYQLFAVVWVIVGIGLVLLMLFCFQTVRRALQPLKVLDHQAQLIANGHFDEPLPTSLRRDSIGRLTNSFIQMQQSLAQTVTDIQHVNAELEQHNDELTRAYQLKLETNRKKSAFIQDIYHEIRTPLNIISGFAQVLSANLHELPDEEIDDITSRMKSSAEIISKIANTITK